MVAWEGRGEQRHSYVLVVVKGWRNYTCVPSQRWQKKVLWSSFFFVLKMYIDYFFFFYFGYPFYFHTTRGIGYLTWKRIFIMCHFFPTRNPLLVKKNLEFIIGKTPYSSFHLGHYFSNASQKTWKENYFLVCNFHFFFCLKNVGLCTLYTMFRKYRFFSL